MRNVKKRRTQRPRRFEKRKKAVGLKGDVEKKRGLQTGHGKLRNLCPHDAGKKGHQRKKNSPKGKPSSGASVKRKLKGDAD